MAFITEENKKITGKEELNVLETQFSKTVKEKYMELLRFLKEITFNHVDEMEVDGNEAELIRSLRKLFDSFEENKKTLFKQLKESKKEYTVETAVKHTMDTLNHRMGILVEKYSNKLNDSINEAIMNNIVKEIKEKLFDEAEYIKYKKEKNKDLFEKTKPAEKKEDVKKNDGMKEKDIAIEEKTGEKEEKPRELSEKEKKLFKNAEENEKEAENWLTEAKAARGTFRDSTAYKNFVDELKKLHVLAELVNIAAEDRADRISLNMVFRNDFDKQEKVGKLLGMKKDQTSISVAAINKRYEEIKAGLGNAAKAYVDYKLADHEIDHKKGSKKKALNAADVRKLNIMKKFCKYDNRLDKLPSNEEFKAGIKVKAAEGKHLEL